MKKKLIILILFFNIITLSAQFSPQVGFGTSDAIFKDDSKIVAWATNCTVQRGWKNITNKSLGYASIGVENDAVGSAGGGSTISLGDSGIAIVTFDSPIKNGIGSDFAVFENAFLYQNAGLAFLELAYVEVSSNGINYYRFASISNTPITSQTDGFGYMDASKIYNLAGKYITNYGTPFDLEELKTISGLDVNNITHIKIIDVIGNINATNTQKDSQNNAINDPFPTPFTTSGFDLDAVAVLHQAATPILKEEAITPILKMYPTVIKSLNELKIVSQKNINNIKISNQYVDGFENLEYLKFSNIYTISNNNMQANGVFFIKIDFDDCVIIKKIIIEN